jgi:hypothetical protein
LHAHAPPVKSSAAAIRTTEQPIATRGKPEDGIDLLLKCIKEMPATAAASGDAFAPVTPALQIALTETRLFFCGTFDAKQRIYVGGLSAESAAEVARETSGYICQRLPVGHSWGETDNIGTAHAEASPAGFSLVQLSLAEKLDAHKKLIVVLKTTVCCSNQY